MNKNNNNNNLNNNKKKEEDIMVVELKKYKQNKNLDPIIDLPFIDMILDENKRKSVYEKYDKKYESSLEEDKIFKEMTKRRKGDKE